MSETLYKLNNRNTIKLSHALNYASYSLGIVALDIVFMLIAQIKNEDEALNTYHINVIDLENRLGRQINRNSLKKAQIELLEQNIVFPKSQSTEPFVWVEKFEYDSKRGTLRIALHPNLAPHLIAPKLYTMANLEAFLLLKSIYAKRLYMLCSQFITMKKFTITLYALRQMLQTPESLSLVYANFKERVILPSTEAINEFSDIHVRFHEIKTGRTISDFEVHVYKKPTHRHTSKPSGHKGIDAVNEWLNSEHSKIQVIDAEIVA
jgi:plasmid replication initiation protein